MRSVSQHFCFALSRLADSSMSPRVLEPEKGSLAQILLMLSFHYILPAVRNGKPTLPSHLFCFPTVLHAFFSQFLPYTGKFFYHLFGTLPFHRMDPVSQGSMLPISSKRRWPPENYSQRCSPLRWLDTGYVSCRVSNVDCATR